MSVKAVGPDEATRLTQAEADAIESITDKINTEIREADRGRIALSTIPVPLYEPHWTNPKVRKEIEDSFREAGWKDLEWYSESFILRR